MASLSRILLKSGEKNDSFFKVVYVACKIIIFLCALNKDIYGIGCPCLARTSLDTNAGEKKMCVIPKHESTQEIKIVSG